MELKIRDRYNDRDIIIVNIVKNKLLEDKLTIKYCLNNSKMIFDMSEDTYNLFISRGILTKI